jgi:CelD/BcsL family acetyltransferase involved in cellulose biosynthesis
MKRPPGLFSFGEFASLTSHLSHPLHPSHPMLPGLRGQDAPPGGFRFMVIDNIAELADHAAAWDQLAAAAVEPNIFHERWMMLPAVEAFARGVDLRFVLAYAERPGGPPLLCGLFPFERAQTYRGLPLAHLRLWRYKHCYLGTPLLRAETVAPCLSALLHWLASDAQGAPLVVWELVASDGPFYAALLDAVTSSRQPCFISESLTRALMRPRASAEAFLAATLPGKARHELRRLERRLSEKGELGYAALEDAADAPHWIARFLELEAQGWKGRRGSALASNDANRRFFVRSAAEAARRGRLGLYALRLSGRDIAMKCNLLVADGCFAFKIAYDERFARYSPGMLLELEHVRRFHARPALRWMDWCSEPHHFMANRLSLDRRSLATLVTATGPASGRWLVACLPGLRWCYRRLRSAITSMKGSP